jgi:hypothetical protein
MIDLFATVEGRSLTKALDAVRMRIAAPILAQWSNKDFDDLVRLMRRFVDDLMRLPTGAGDAREDLK